MNAQCLEVMPDQISPAVETEAQPDFTPTRQQEATIETPDEAETQQSAWEMLGLIIILAGIILLRYAQTSVWLHSSGW